MTMPFKRWVLANEMALLPARRALTIRDPWGVDWQPGWAANRQVRVNFIIREHRVLSFIAKWLPNGKLLDMKTTVTVDEVGRMVLPKPVREAIGISGRTNVTIEIVSGTAQIAVIDRRNGPVTRRRGRTVYAGPLPPEWDSGEAISRMRERRNRQ